MVEIRIEGLEELERHLRKLEQLPEQIKREVKEKLIYWMEQIKVLARKKIPEDLKKYEETITYDVVEMHERVEIKMKCEPSVSGYVKEAFDELKQRMDQSIRDAIDQVIRNL